MTVRKFKKGDKLVYPHHGACIVEKIEKRTAFGSSRTTSSSGSRTRTWS